MINLNVVLGLFAVVFTIGIVISYMVHSINPIDLYWMYTIFYLVMTVVFTCTTVFIS